MASDPSPISVTHNAEQSRFEAHVNGLLCVADYNLRKNDVMVVTHTGVPHALRGQGIAAELMRALLDHARAGQLRVDPQCSYAAAYMQRHPETHDLLAR